jgi:selenide,water dikinase
MAPIPGVRLTLVSRGVVTPYSGMLPGLIAGHYTFDEAHIDLRRLCRYAGAAAVFDEAVKLDLAARRVHLASRPPMSYDLLSIDVGSTPDLAVPGAAEHAVPVKPIGGLLERWSSMRERIEREGGPRRIAVVGGGAGGVEILLALQFRLGLRSEMARGALQPVEFHLFAEGPHVLPTHNHLTRSRFERILDSRGVVLHVDSRVTEVDAGRLRTADGAWHDADEVLWATQAAAPRWLKSSGLAVDEAGFVRVSTTLQSVSHREVFASGDAATIVGHPRPKAGVFAVRQGPPLAHNLRHALLGEPLEVHLPQQRFLSIISTGDQYAVASRGPWSLAGRWVWRWKDRIDRRFMRSYRDLPYQSELAPRR